MAADLNTQPNFTSPSMKTPGQGSLLTPEMQTDEDKWAKPRTKREQAARRRKVRRIMLQRQQRFPEIAS